MTQEQIQQTVDAINATASKIKGSREASRKFLIDAGIILPDKKKKTKLRKA